MIDSEGLSDSSAESVSDNAGAVDGQLVEQLDNAVCVSASIDWA